MKIILSFLIFILPLLGDSIPQLKEKLVSELRAYENSQTAILKYNRCLREELHNLFLMAARNTELSSDIRWALYAFGSTSLQISLPDSDLEFGLLISEDTPATQEALKRVVAEFKRLIENEGAHFDKRRWHPPLPDEKHTEECHIFIATPKELALVRNQRGRNILRYALYHLQYIGGDEALMGEFEYWKTEISGNFREVIHEVLFRTIGAVQGTVKIAHLMYKYMAVQGGNLGFPVKKNWIKPAIESIQYLSIHNKIEPANPYDALNRLEENGVFTPQFKKEVADYLDFMLRIRAIYGNDIKCKDLTSEEFNCFINYLQVLMTLFTTAYTQK